jgi:Flp pilus assembly protein TadG
MLRREKNRSGATVVECAFIYPLFFLIVVGLVVGCLGVFRYQELASLSREAARWASVRGHQYQNATGETAATAKDVYDNVIKPKAKLVDATDLTYSVTWDPDNRQGSKVTVTVTYHWVPEAVFGGIDLTSTSTMIMSY